MAAVSGAQRLPSHRRLIVMCTVSFIPNKTGFDLAMNRDEQLGRMAALPPAMIEHGVFKALYPRELQGGTWIGLNEAGLAFALINWYSETQRQAAGTLSRGGVIPALLATATARDAESALMEMPLKRLNPFRIIVISLAEHCLHEWRSNGEMIKGSVLPWDKHHWFSSGFDEATANRIRLATCQQAAQELDADTLPWLRRLHSSHHPAKDAFSICMHRIGACTVSYTEIVADSKSAVMTYHASPMCGRGPHLSSCVRLLLRTKH